MNNSIRNIRVNWDDLCDKRVWGVRRLAQQKPHKFGLLQINASKILYKGMCEEYDSVLDIHRDTHGKLLQLSKRALINSQCAFITC